MCVFMSTFCKLLRQQRTFLFTREKSNADAKCMSLDSAKMILHEIWFDLIAPPPCRTSSSACIISTQFRAFHILPSPFGEGSRQVSFETTIRVYFKIRVRRNSIPLSKINVFIEIMQTPTFELHCFSTFRDNPTNVCPNRFEKRCI